jgi:hypothetical protein
VFDLRKNTEYKVVAQSAGSDCIEYKVVLPAAGRVCIEYKVVLQSAGRVCIEYKVALQAAGRLCIEYKMSLQSAGRVCIEYKMVAQGAGMEQTLFFHAGHSNLSNLISTLFSRQNNLSSQRAIPPFPQTLLTLFSLRVGIKKLIRLIRFGEVGGLFATKVVLSRK